MEALPAQVSPRCFGSGVPPWFSDDGMAATARILVVDNDASVRTAVATALAGAGHDVESVSSGVAALAIARAVRPELVVVDLALADSNGLDFVRAMRGDAGTGAPLIVVLTAVSEEEERIAAFEAGVDDYIVKPCSTRELILRVRALSRRRTQAPPSDSMQLGALRIDVAARQAWIDGQRVDLTRREFDVLQELAARAGRVQTREVLIANAWGDVEHSPRIVDTTVKRLRRKIVAAGCEIRTLRGVGYKLVASEEDCR